MNRAPLIFLGIFFAIAFSWTGIILTNQISYGRLTPYVNADDGKAYPQSVPGDAARGKLVYQDLGCIYCHTQQVRQPGFGIDIERGWGERGSVARDYIRESRVFLGTMRTGPDLRNVGTRFAGQGGREWHIKHFYDPTITSAGSIMAPYRFLFETKAIIGDASPKAVQSLLPENHQPVAGSEIVLKQRGEDLIAYMLSLKDPELYPEEATKVYVPKAEPAKTEHGAHGAESKKEAAK